MKRRTFLGTSLAAAASAVIAAEITGCTTRSRPAPPSPASPAAGSGSSRVLLAFFSRAGENYFNGSRTFLEVGNTQVVADMIAAAAAVDVFPIEAADPYPDSYDATVARNQQEQRDNARPAIAGARPNLDSYDTIVLGSPIWNQQPPMIMRTFIEGTRLNGKALLPFVTYAVSGLGSTVDVYRQLAPQSTIGAALAVRGEEAANAQPQVQAWLRGSGLIA
jgi:flavodoxin